METILLVKAASMDRTNNTEVQEFNKLLNEYKEIAIGSNKPTEKPADLHKQFNKVQSDLLDKDLVGKFKIDNSTTEEQIDFTDVRAFHKKLIGE